ncbi:MAG: hypothetical protein IKY38_02045, partial [Anaerotignum sp.]|nr:hypothetical protein [Anaerotignum sp.]
MKDYHFQENEQDFGLTVRLDDINEKVKQLQKETAEDELGDANDFLKAFESEKFDVPAVEAEGEEEMGDTIQPASVKPAKKQAEAPVEEEWDEYDEDEPRGLSRKAMALIGVLAVVACILGFAFVRGGFGGTVSVPSDADALPMLVESVLDAEEVVVYDIAEEERRTLRLTEKTEIIDELGNVISGGSLEMGDLVMVELDKDGKTALSVDYSHAAVERAEETGL